ncbi:MAG: FtsW/RodA/SpoVE family cell cycle protein, partial [Thermacetogeniaceae bacterium]
MLKKLDYNFLIAIVLMLGMSLLVLSSATANLASDPLFYVKKQLLWITVGVAAAILVLSFDYTKLLRYQHPIYCILLVLLSIVMVIGHASHGKQLWISLGPFLFQPSELGKVMIIICFAAFLVKRQGELQRLRDLIPCFLYFFVPVALVIAQGDLGTALVFIVICFGMLYLAGARPSLLLALLGGGLAVVALAIALHFSPLHLPLPLEEYQIKRLIVFINPYWDPQGAGYNI